MKTILALIAAATIAFSSIGSPNANDKLSNMKLAKEIEFTGLVFTHNKLKEFVAADGKGEWSSSTHMELLKSLKDQSPSYLVLRFKNTTGKGISGIVNVGISKGSGKGVVNNVPIFLHVKERWIDYFLPLDSWMWPMDPIEVPEVYIKWNQLLAQ